MFSSNTDVATGTDSTASTRERERELVLAAMSMISAGAKGAYLEALQNAPHIVNTESDPSLFLRVEDGCADRAAARLAALWTLRKQEFGERFCRSVLDLTGAGALTAEDMDLVRVGGYMPLLSDAAGRALIVADADRRLGLHVPSVRTGARQRVVFAALTRIAMGNETAQTEGIRVLRIVRTNIFDPATLRYHLDLLNRVMPLKLYDFTFVAIPPPAARKHFERTVLPLMKAALHGEHRILLGRNEASLLHELESLGFSKERLPTELGGTWSYESFYKWLEDQMTQRLEAHTDTKPAPLKRRERRLKNAMTLPVQVRVVWSPERTSKRHVDHTYRDFSQVPADAEYQADAQDVRSMSFTSKLHWLLEQRSIEDFIHWLPHGRAFKIRDLERLQESGIIQDCFGISRVSIFILHLRSHGFKQLTKGLDRGSFYHECMLRGRGHLCQHMHTPRDARTRLPDPTNEPNLYMITAQYPLQTHQ